MCFLPFSHFPIFLFSLSSLSLWLSALPLFALFPSSLTQRQPADIGMRMALCSWHPLYTSLSALLTKTNDEGLIQLLLKAHQLCIHTCGLLHMTTPRDAFLTSLCKSCLPPPLALSQSNQIVSRTVVLFILVSLLLIFFSYF